MKLNIVGAGGIHVQADCGSHHESHSFRFGLSNRVRSLAAAVGAVEEFMACFVDQHAELFCWAQRGQQRNPVWSEKWISSCDAALKGRDNELTRCRESWTRSGSC
jgi:hypothetical protein